MSSALLQLTALLTMAIDHAGYRLFPGTELMRMIGRVSFPLFVFMLTEGFARTSDRGKYLSRLAAFALLSEIPYKLFTSGGRWMESLIRDPMSNVFFELLLIFTALWGIKLAAERGWPFYGITALSVVLAEAFGTMYGIYGVLMGIFFCVFRDRRWLCAVSLIVLTGLYCWQHGSMFQIYAVFAAVPIFLYNGRQGRRLPRYFSYIFYPAHLLVIYGIYCLI